MKSNNELVSTVNLTENEECRMLHACMQLLSTVSRSVIYLDTEECSPHYIYDFHPFSHLIITNRIETSQCNKLV